jgi:hypothetical protein
VLLRSAGLGLDIKRASKCAAALEFANHHAVTPKRLAAFLWSKGGVEGAARGRAKLRGSGDL